MFLFFLAFWHRPYNTPTHSCFALPFDTAEKNTQINELVCVHVTPWVAPNSDSAMYICISCYTGLLLGVVRWTPIYALHHPTSESASSALFVLFTFAQMLQVQLQSANSAPTQSRIQPIQLCPAWPLLSFRHLLKINARARIVISIFKFINLLLFQIFKFFVLKKKCVKIYR